MNRCVFFDRDGVVNVSPGAGYVTSWKGFHFSEGLFEAMARVQDAGMLAVLVTSQRGVGKGLMAAEGLADIHGRMQRQLQQNTGVGFDAIYAFDGTPATASWEKPNPEMILLAAAKYEIDLERSFMVGDADRDIEMANRAGVGTTIRVLGDKPVGIEADHTIGAVLELSDLLAELLSESDPRS